MKIDNKGFVCPVIYASAVELAQLANAALGAIQGQEAVLNIKGRPAIAFRLDDE